MANKKRVPQAPREPVPELTEFLEPFQLHFKRRESQTALDRYLTGLLTDHPNKNCDTLAHIVPGSSEQQLQGLLPQMVWDDERLNRQRAEVMQSLRTEGDGVLLFDDTGFAKQGQHSVGVARQYSGTLGKVANCQVTVNCHYAERTLAWPVATRLYLPQAWSEDVERRSEAQVPPEVRFLTKAEVALALLDQANAWGVRHAAVVADGDYGDNPGFLNGLETRQEPYVVAIRANFSIVLARRAAAQVQRADAVLAALPRWQWPTIAWREGSRGWLRAKFATIRCWRVDGNGTRHMGWLIGQRPTRGEGERKYFWSNFPPTASLAVMVEYTHRRYWVEQFYEEAKELLGWDQYQGRLPAPVAVAGTGWQGFHRNAVLTMLSYSFLVWLEWRQRQETRPRGRPRRAFSPSARSQAALTGNDPSLGGGTLT